MAKNTRQVAKPDGTVWSLPAGILHQAEGKLYKELGSNGAQVMNSLAGNDRYAKQAAKILEQHFLPHSATRRTQGKSVAHRVLADLDWVKTYASLGFSFNPASIVVIDDKDYWPIIVLPGLTCNGIVRAFRTAGVMIETCVDDVDKAVVKNDRSPNAGPYIVYVRRRVEADYELKNLSANDLTVRSINGVTLAERLLHGYAYYLTVGKHLDVRNRTLCSGSRYSDGGVPDVSWSSFYREVYVNWYNPGSRFDSMRARTAVSLPA